MKWSTWIRDLWLIVMNVQHMVGQPFFAAVFEMFILLNLVGESKRIETNRIELNYMSIRIRFHRFGSDISYTYQYVNSIDTATQHSIFNGNFVISANWMRLTWFRLSDLLCYVAIFLFIFLTYQFLQIKLWIRFVYDFWL